MKHAKLINTIRDMAGNGPANHYQAILDALAHEADTAQRRYEDAIIKARRELFESKSIDETQYHILRNL